MMRRRRIAMVAASLLALVAADIWILVALGRSRSQATADAEELTECLALAEEVRAGRRLPAAAAEQERENIEISRSIEAGAKAVGIASRDLLRISPEPARRIEDTSYKEKPTSVLLKEVNAIFSYRDIPYLGSLQCSDERLNEIWETGAYTVHLNMQHYLCLAVLFHQIQYFSMILEFEDAPLHDIISIGIQNGVLTGVH